MPSSSSFGDETAIAQAGAIPYRRGPEIEFCLITSSSGLRWGFPKGIIEPGNSAADTALQEAYEEAGLQGRLVGEPLGTYRYQKWGTNLDVTVYLMEVSQADDSWEEAAIRERLWVSPAEALDRLDREELQGLLRSALVRLA